MFKRLSIFVYGVLSYAVFFATYLYAIGFVGNLWVPKSMDSVREAPFTTALLIDLGLLGLFAIQHSVMARPAFKRWWTQYVSKSIERSTYVLMASLALILLFWQWRPIPTTIWLVEQPALAAGLTALSFVGWLIVLSSTFMINHFELFGLHQVVNNARGKSMPDVHFKTPALYKLVRHPIYLGFIIAFWATPHMTVGHLLFAAVTTGYILVGIFLEERDLIDLFGDEYRAYRKRVSMLIPWRKSAQEAPLPSTPRKASLSR